MFAYGSSQDKKLGIPGEDEFNGIYAARHFVGWYNGLPEHASLQPDLSTGDTAVVIGQGNVALDVARILLTDIDLLRKTDIAEHALAVLAKSRVQRVNVVGRRGPMQVGSQWRIILCVSLLRWHQASFTIREVRELAQLPSVSFEPVEESLLPPTGMKLSRTPKRLVDLLRQGPHLNKSPRDKAFALQFLRSPVEFQGVANQLGAVKFQHNEFSHSEERYTSNAQVIPQLRTLSITSTSLAFRSIGYRSTAMEGMKQLGIHFKHAVGVIANDSFGRATQEPATEQALEHSEKVLPGIYCAGWVKRGPAGVIANTMEDAFATAEAISSDWRQQKPFLDGGKGWDVLSQMAAAKDLQTVSWSDWLAIDAAERSQGRPQGKEREKYASISGMLDVLKRAP